MENLINERRARILEMIKDEYKDKVFAELDNVLAPAVFASILGILYDMIEETSNEIPSEQRVILLKNFANDINELISNS